MNGANADSTAAVLAASKQAAAGRWSRRRWLMFVALVFAVQLAIIFALGEKQSPPPRAVANVPHMTLADNSSKLLALDDPTLFAMPHANDFASAVWRRTPVTPPPSFRWTETPGELLSPAGENLGAVFTRFMGTNQFAQFSPDFKPAAKVSEPVLSLPLMAAENSTLQISGDLTQRKLISVENLPAWPLADVIAPSRVQLLVDAAGAVVSAVLIPPDNRAGAAAQYDPANQRALAIARTARFASSSHPTVGQMIFNWRTVTPPTTNMPASPP